MGHEVAVDAEGGPPLVAGAASPELAAAFAERFEALMSGLEDEERQIVELKREDLANHEVAERLGCSERTVRRILKRLRARSEAVLGA